MADTNSAQSIGQLQTEIDELRATLRLVDQLCQESLGQIQAVAKLAMESLKSPQTPAYKETLARVLQLVWERAFDLEGQVNETAKQAGADHIDVDRLMRAKATVASTSPGVQ
jgi:hypothetical protein